MRIAPPTARRAAPASRRGARGARRPPRRPSAQRAPARPCRTWPSTAGAAPAARGGTYSSARTAAASRPPRRSRLRDSTITCAGAAAPAAAPAPASRSWLCAWPWSLPSPGPLSEWALARDAATQPIGASVAPAGAACAAASPCPAALGLLLRARCRAGSGAAALARPCAARRCRLLSRATLNLREGRTGVSGGRVARCTPGQHVASQELGLLETRDDSHSMQGSGRVPTPGAGDARAAGHAGPGAHRRGAPHGSALRPRALDRRAPARPRGRAPRGRVGALLQPPGHLRQRL